MGTSKRCGNYDSKGRKGMTPSPKRKRQRYADRERAAGRPMRVPAARAREHREALRAVGMTDQAIANAATANGFPIHQVTVTMVGAKSPNCHRDTEAAILSVDVETATPQPHKLVPIIGVQRAIQGLVAAGYTLSWISNNVVYGDGGGKKDNRSIAYALLSRKFIRVELQTFERTWKTAQKLEHTDPHDMGLGNNQISRAKNYAAKHGFVPLHCWDDDTIMDPGAYPEWTGACGTIHGYNLHRKHKIGVEISYDRDGNERMAVDCEACCSARKEAKTQRDVEVTIRRDKATAAILDGVPYRVIGRELGLSTRTVQRIARELEGNDGGPDEGSESDDA